MNTQQKPRFGNRIGDPVSPQKPGRIGLLGLALVYSGVLARTFTLELSGILLARYLGLEILFLILYCLVLWKPRLPRWLMHGYFIVQCAIILALLSFSPGFDFVVVLFFLLSYAAVLYFSLRVCWYWISIIVLLTGGSLIFYFGFLQGLALALTTMAAEIVIPAYLIINREIEAAKTRNQGLLNELNETHQQLKRYAGQVEELAAVQERNRLARTFHDSVSQKIFSISLTASSARSLVEKDPARARAEINRLQALTAEALRQLRSLITEMRPPQQ
jgi:signal transduction histidine kinase